MSCECCSSFGSVNQLTFTKYELAIIFSALNAYGSELDKMLLKTGNESSLATYTLRKDELRAVRELIGKIVK